MHHSVSEIKDLLCRIEIDHRLSVIYGLESGSRAWGFGSQNSDYDIRFLYVRSVDWYLCIEKRDNILELETANDFDLSGWDLKKALLFLRKSHPVLLEWLRSPIVYVEHSASVQQMREIGKEFFSPRSSLHHYIGWSERTIHRYFQQPNLAAKRYLYAMRPILCCRWIQTVGEQPPLQIQDLITAVDIPIEARLALEDLIKRKRAGHELSLVGRIPVLDHYIHEAIPQIKDFMLTLPKPEYVPFEILNPLFRKTLEELSVHSLR